MAALTPAQRKGLEILKEHGPLRPREFAKLMWPDSPAWNRRTKGRRTGTIAGAVGGTMPMLGAKLLRRLQDLACAADYDNDWRITERGRQRLNELAGL